VPFYEGGAQERLLNWYHQGINAFEKTCAIGQVVFGAFEAELLAALIDPEVEHFLPLLARTERYASELVAQLQAGRDKLLELNSCKPAQAAVLVEALSNEQNAQQLAHYMESVFDSFGVDHEVHSAQSLVLHPSDHMRVASFPGLPEAGVTVTYDREQALTREDMQYLTWEHPLVRGAQDLIALTEFGNTAFCSLKLPPLKPGTLLLEALYVLHCPAPAELQLFRYMPQSLIRVLVDDKGKDLSQVLGIDQFSKLLQKVPRNNAQDLVRHARPALTGMLQQAEKITETKQAALISSASDSVTLELTAELARMRALAEVNPSVRMQEIEYLEQRLVQAKTYLAQAQLRLDALRVVITV
jgi:ATP-dependent helicase HepA